MFLSGGNGMGATTLAGDLPTHPGEGHTAENSTVVYGMGYNCTSAKRLEKGLVLEGTGRFPGCPGWVLVEQRLRLSRVPRIPLVSLPVGPSTEYTIRPSRLQRRGLLVPGS